MHSHNVNPFKTHAIPFAVYGDGTPATGVGKAWVKLVDGILLSSMLTTSGITRLNNYIISMLQAELMRTSEAKLNITLDTMGVGVVIVLVV